MTDLRPPSRDPRVEARARGHGLLASSIVAPAAPRPPAWLLVLHGIYGRGRNWTSVARALAARRSDWACVLVDLRLHGASPAFEPPHTVRSAAADLGRFERATGFVAGAVAGHSFGGKVALAHAECGGERLAQVWVLDSTPEVRPPAGSAWRLLEVVRALPDRFTSRAEAAGAIERHGYAPTIAAWMASNLAQHEGTYRWRLDLDAMEALLRSFFETDLWTVVESPPPGTSIHFVKAESSGVLSDHACGRIEDAGRHHGRVHLHRIAGGHWVNVDNPGAVVELLAAHLPRHGAGPAR